MAIELPQDFSEFLRLLGAMHNRQGFVIQWHHYVRSGYP